EVVEGATGLGGDVAVDQVPGGRIDRHLAGEEHDGRSRRIPGAGRLGVRADGRGCAVAVDSLSGHGPILQALHAVHHGQATDLADHVGDVAAVADLDGEADLGDVAVALQVFDPVDVRLGLGDRRCDLGQDAGAVLDLDHQGAVEIAGDLAVPADGDPALGRLAVVGHVGAGAPVHDDALAGGVVAHDLVAGDGHAAVGEGDHAALVAGDQDAVAGDAGAAGQAFLLRALQGLDQVRRGRVLDRQHPGDLARHAVAQ